MVIQVRDFAIALDTSLSPDKYISNARTYAVRIRNENDMLRIALVFYGFGLLALHVLRPRSKLPLAWSDLAHADRSAKWIAEPRALHIQLS